MGEIIITNFEGARAALKAIRAKSPHMEYLTDSNSQRIDEYRQEGKKYMRFIAKYERAGGVFYKTVFADTVKSAMTEARRLGGTVYTLKSITLED